MSEAIKIAQKENRKKLVKYLRDTNKKQGKGCLCSNDEFCCLGLACEVAIENGVNVSKELQIDSRYQYNGAELWLPLKVQQWLGFATANGRMINHEKECLTNINDSGYTFSEIADLIEQDRVELE